MARLIKHLTLLVALTVAGATLVAAPAGAKPTWQPVTNMYADLSATGGSAQAPDVAVDGEGNATAVWSRSTGSGFVVQAATREAGGAWSAPVDLTPASNGYDAQVVVDAAGNATAIWRTRNAQTTVVQSASRPAGGAWSAAVDLSADVIDIAYTPANDDGPQIAVDSDGNVTATWSRYASPRFVVQSASRPAGGAWTTPVDVSALDHDSDHSSLALDPAGNATVVWTATQGNGSGAPGAPAAKIQAATRPAGGTWSAPVDLTAAGPASYVFPPRVVVDAVGEVTAVWQSLVGSYVVQSATRPAQGPWTAPVTVSAPGEDTSNPDVAVDEQGTTTAIWQGHDGDNWIVRTARRPVGAAWSTSIDLSDPGKDATNPRVIADRAGTTTAMWTRSDGKADQIQAATRPTGGSWTSPVDLSVPGDGPSSIPFLTTGDASNPEIVADPAGNVTAVWSRFDGGSWIVQARGLDAAGPVVTELDSPVTGAAGQKQRYAVTAHDVWSTVDSVVWDFGDGTTATGTAVSHVNGERRTGPAKVTLTDAVGNVTVCRTTCRSFTRAAPAITRARLKPRRIEITGPRRKTRTSLVLRLTEPATVVVSLKRKGASGTHAHAKVVLRKRVDDGRTRLRLTSKRLQRRLGVRRFTPGRYQVTVTAVNRDGKDRRTLTLRVRR